MFKKIKENPIKTKNALKFGLSMGLITYGVLTILEIIEEVK